MRKNQTIKNKMKKSTEIKEKIICGKYYNLLICISSAIYLYIFGIFYFQLTVIVAALFFIGLLSNEYINPENVGGIAIVQMFIIVFMIGAYDYFSLSGNRLNNFINFLLPITAVLFFVWSA